MRVARAMQVAVRRDEAEAVHAARVDQVHRAHDEREVGRVLALEVAELLVRPDAQRVDHMLPRRELRRGPVAIGAAHRGPAERGGLVHHEGSLGGAGVFSVDEYCESWATHYSTHVAGRFLGTAVDEDFSTSRPLTYL